MTALVMGGLVWLVAIFGALGYLMGCEHGEQATASDWRERAQRAFFNGVAFGFRMGATRRSAAPRGPIEEIAAAMGQRAQTRWSVTAPLDPEDRAP